MTIEPRLVWPVGALLGEGPAWFPDEGALRFVDIKGGKLHRYVPETGLKETATFDGQPSFIVSAGAGQCLIGSGCQLLPVAHDGVVGPPVAEVIMPTHNRTNDATVDCHGRLWFGTMDDSERLPTGAIYCLDKGTLHRMGGEAVVTNGPAISRDGATLYHVDSGRRTIWRHRVGDGPRLEGGEVFLQLTESDGYPDGIVLDSEDCLWVAFWDGWGVRRYAPRWTPVADGGAPLRARHQNRVRRR